MKQRRTIKISKTDAAKRQLETAIRLWFYSGDPVSIHTLAAAALQLLHDLGQKQGTGAILRDLPGVLAGRRNELRKLIKGYENFFKHADNDPNALLDFCPDATELFILDAVLTYTKLTGDSAPIFDTFRVWVLAHNPKYMDIPSRKKFFESLKIYGTDFLNVPKTIFFAEFLKLLEKTSLS
jgi:hypothetical protein